MFPSRSSVQPYLWLSFHRSRWSIQSGLWMQRLPAIFFVHIGLGWWDMLSRHIQEPLYSSHLGESETKSTLFSIKVSMICENFLCTELVPFVNEEPNPWKGIHTHAHSCTHVHAESKLRISQLLNKMQAAHLMFSILNSPHIKAAATAMLMLFSLNHCWGDFASFVQKRSMLSFSS